MDKNSAVFDADSKPVRAFYAAGEVAGGVHGNNRLGGNSLLDCVVLSRVVISGSDFAAQHTTSPHHASHPMRVILDLDVIFCRDAFFVVVQSESELRSSVDAAVALVGVITLWTSPPCSLALWFSVTRAMK